MLNSDRYSVGNHIQIIIKQYLDPIIIQIIKNNTYNGVSLEPPTSCSTTFVNTSPPNFLAQHPNLNKFTKARTNENKHK